MPDEDDIVRALSGAALTSLSRIPGLGEAIAGWDAYNRSKFERNLQRAVSYLQEQVADLKTLFSDEWLQAEEGQEFCRKIIDCVFDAQVEEKQQLFLNALINGVRDQDTSTLEKLKFVDILRGLSLAALHVLAEMHSMFQDQIRGPKRKYNSLSALPLVDPNKIARQLSDRYDPYLVTSAISEMESSGLFSNVGEWRRSHEGTAIAGTGFDNALCYTDFTARFVEFVILDTSKRRLG